MQAVADDRDDALELLVQSEEGDESDGSDDDSVDDDIVRDAETVLTGSGDEISVAGDGDVDCVVEASELDGEEGTEVVGIESVDVVE